MFLLSFWPDLFQQPTLPASTANYAQLVHDSTTQLQQSLECILSALNLRSMALSKCANFDAALRDANAMQQLSPSSALGYLRAAEVYSAQGIQRRVVDICNHGLRMANTKDTHYATLQLAKEDAMHQSSKRVDFISQLPIDIVFTVLMPMFIDRYPLDDESVQLRYLRVSNVWHDRIIQYLDGLRFNSVFEYDHAAWCSLVKKFSQDTRSLNVRYYSQGTWLSDLLRDNTFCSLRELRIHGFANQQITTFVSSLKSIGSTLTDLLIRVEDGYVLPIADVLMACPNLVSLAMTRPSNVVLSALPMTTWSKMTTLSITNATEEITSDHVVEIWKRFPSLKKLALHPCSDIQSAFVVSDYCPSMRKIALDMKSGCTALTFLDQEHGSEEHGITDLTFDGYSPFSFSYEEICSLLKQHQSTLHFLQWGIDLHMENHDIYSIQYPQLKKLVIRCSGWWLPRNAPLLEELDITTRAVNVTDEELSTIPPNLQKLSLRFDTSPLPDKTPIIQYLNRTAEHSHFYHLVVHFQIKDTFGEIHDAISRLNQLERLTIIYTYDWNYMEMERFFGKLVKGCPRLTRLELSGTPTTYSINALKQLEHLKELSFSIHWHDGDPRFWDAVQALSQVKCVRIYPSISVQMRRITHLRAQRPDMKVIVDDAFRHF